MLDELNRIRKSASLEIPAAHSSERLEALRIQFLGREQGALTLILRGLKDLPESERKKVGAAANRLRTDLEILFAHQRETLKKGAGTSRLLSERLDVTRPGIRVRRGHLHPITQVLRKIENIFLRMGFTVAEGPEIETEYYNFDALNIPDNHPARDMWDTFWLKPERVKSERLLLRTHTSPVQIRYMEKNAPPIRIISPGVVYRYEATDASHDIEFWQIEGLMVDRHISVGNFKAVISRFFSDLFGGKVEIRLRPAYFPFVEPGFEVDVMCLQCRGQGCSVCSKTGWLEMMGAGMVHPSVFKAVGYNPNPTTGGVQGFAFGMGLDRLVMMNYKIPDVRLMRGGDLRFLKQF
ncbi:MAG: phenylalanine--tRNA ligase subunit alpha [Candidatus Sungbacteria bacterium]|uniref:Phenylalanine--tRNA ligase alpha subunit n=1 Tax=Candidatus Sungiibacteriota bacterium TaxID=2750080 RepID=A0A9D6LPP5_9BACT|nr:phenylalanine--tRNA ligase subunit alpha [Candidatus Sungbacteria bacterium]